MGDEDGSKYDVNSPNFDPVLALYSDRVAIPRPDALILDNVAKFDFLFSKCPKDSPVKLDELLKQTKQVKEECQPTTSKELAAPRQGSEETVQTKPRKTRRPRNVLTRISNASGPLAFLRDCMEKRIRVKVWTRNAAGIRGYCLGFVVAFDRHWNLAMADVKEVWSRRVRRKAVHFGDEFDPPREWKLMGPMVTPPKVVVLKTEKGVETCERHVNQMLMRGEHVAFISVTDA
ncbi:UNVERIFIED_CONTAM: hypothetical protein PYX00_003704 [Menopon gallinae]|uniref:Sm domain-containing protein n=1 Tax=Menopon gallinae TaxID=328185 RepID=A0AAW2I2M3_9NEOP